MYVRYTRIIIYNNSVYHGLEFAHDHDDDVDDDEY